jgi:hypothetical protein
MQPATTPDTLGCGRWAAHATLAGSSSFGWRQSAEGNEPSYRAFLADAESWTLAVSAAYGATDDLDVGLRVPVMWRGGGFMDSMIDLFHEATGTLDNMRPDFAKDQYIVDGTLEDGRPWSWTEDDGAGLGNLEAFARWRFLDGGRDGLSAALHAQATVPTGTGPFRTGGVAAGLQVVAAHRFLRVFDFYAGAGGTWFSETEVDGVEYEPFRASAFAALEWRCLRWASLFAQLQWGSRLVTNVHLFPGTQLYLNFGAKIDLSPGTVLELGFTENLEDQQSTSDFGVWFGLEHRL